MEHPGGQPPTPCAPHASYAGMRACARYAGACASRASYTGMRARARCAGAPLRSPSPAASRTVAPPSIGCNCKARGKVSLIAPNHPERVVSVISVDDRALVGAAAPPSSRGTHPRPFAPQRSTCAPTRPPLMLPRHPVARHTCAASCQARGGEPGTLRNGSLSTLCLEMPRSAGLLSLFEHQLPPRWRMIRSR